MIEQTTEVAKEPIRPEVVSEIKPRKTPLKTVLLVVLGLIILAGAVYAGITIGKKLSPPEVIPQITEVSPTSSETANWKTAAIGNVSFKYPPNWDNPETVSLGFGSGLDIKSSDNLYRLTFSTGISKGSNLGDLEKFIDDLVSGGGEKISVDNNLASVSKVEYQGVETITTYIISPTKDQLYALSLSSRATSKEIRNLFDQILSTFKFLDQQNISEENWKINYSNPKVPHGKNFSFWSPVNWNFDGQVLVNYDYTKTSLKSGFPPGSVKCDFIPPVYDDRAEIKKKIFDGEIKISEGIFSDPEQAKIFGGGSQLTYFLIENKSLNLSIGMICYSYDPEQESLLTQILSTFKFLD